MGQIGADIGRSFLGLAGSILFPGWGGLAGSLLGGILFPGSGPSTVQRLHIPTPQKGQPLPLLWGTRRIEGHYIWYGNFLVHQGGKVAKGGKGGGGGGKKAPGGKKSNQDSFSVSFAVALCEGVDTPGQLRLMKIWSGKDVIWTHPSENDDGEAVIHYTPTGNPNKKGPGSSKKGGPGGIDFLVYKGVPGQLPDPTMAQFTSGEAETTGIILGLGPQQSESFFASGSYSSFTAVAYTLTNPPVGPGTDSVYYAFGSEYHYLSGVAAPASPSQGEYSINYANGQIVLGPAPAELSNDGSWPGITVFVNYQHAIGETVVAVGALAYPHVAYCVFPNFNLGASPALPNLTFEVSRLPANSPVKQTEYLNIWLDGGSGAGRNVDWYTLDGVNWNVFRGDDGSATGLSSFWQDETSAGFRTSDHAQVLLRSIMSDGSLPMNILYTSDGGDSWIEKTPTFPIGSSPSIFAYLSTGTILAFSRGTVSQVCEVLRSTDGGLTFSGIALPGAFFSGVEGTEFSIDPNGGIWIAAWTEIGGVASFGVWVSNDDGQTWISKRSGSFVSSEFLSFDVTTRITPVGYVILLAYSLQEIIFPFTITTQIWRSIDLGNTWTESLSLTGSGVTFPGGQYLATSGAANEHSNPGYCSNGDFLSIMNSAADAFGDLFLHAWRSTDNGNTFLADDASLPITSSFINGTARIWADTVGDTIGMIGRIANVSHPYPGYTPKWKSGDGGHTWTEISFDPPFGDNSEDPRQMWSIPLPDTPNPLGGDVNLLDVMYDVITEDRSLLGLDKSIIDFNTWIIARRYTQNIGLFGSPYFDKVNGALSYMQRLLEIYDGYLVPSQGVIRFGARQPLFVGTEISFPDFQWGQLPQVSKQALRDTKNRVVIQYTNRFNDYNQAGVKLDNDIDIRSTTERIDQVDMTDICSESVAALVCSRRFLYMSTPKLMVRHGLEPKWGLTDAGDHYVLDAAGVDILDTAFQIESIEEDENYGLAIIAIEDPLAIPPFIPVFGTQAPVNPGESPPLSNFLGEALGFVVETPRDIAGTGNLVLQTFSALLGSNWVGTIVFVSRDGTNYAKVGVISNPTQAGFLTEDFEVLPDATEQSEGIDCSESGAALVSINADGFFALQSLLIAGLVAATPTTPAVQPNTAEWIAWKNATLVSGERFILDTFIRGLFHTEPNDWPKGTQSVIPSSAGGASVLIPFSQSDIGRPIYIKFQAMWVAGGVSVTSDPTFLVITPQGLAVDPEPVSGLTVVNPEGVRFGVGDFSGETADNAISF